MPDDRLTPRSAQRPGDHCYGPKPANTPKMSLPAGKHRITLINNEFGINERFVVDIKPDAVEKVIKDFSDKLPK